MEKSEEKDLGVIIHDILTTERVRSTQEHISMRHTMAGGWRAPPDRETPAYSRPLLSPQFTGQPPHIHTGHSGTLQAFPGAGTTAGSTS
ncbi:hypothetical protein E2C01_052601 [Portunus trituberculatus]|uniref:Uncharacterized protein n=1 Tax=Portunus trituberculatus TaxID=210409 RepID=A0A5B7GPT9_PORTR|nr:hypothetical protein [Portunus trituberculatus]